MQREDILDDFDEDFEYSNQTDNKDDIEFDNIVDKLQDIVLETKFVDLQQDFLNQNSIQFDFDEENKMEYMTLFKQYQKQLDSHIQQELTQRVQGFQMERFQELLSNRTDRIDPQILDMLYSITDFESFKSLMLDHKTMIMSMSKKKQIKQKISNDNDNPFKIQLDNRPIQQQKGQGTYFREKETLRN